MPDLVILDVAMPGLNGNEVAGRARKRRPELRVILLSMHSDESYIMRALAAGARGRSRIGKNRAPLRGRVAPASARLPSVSNIAACVECFQSRSYSRRGSRAMIHVAMSRTTPASTLPGVS
jgi:CheY-like chemotaxis protein